MNQDQVRHTLLSLFEDSCLRYADKPVFTCEDEHLSFRELDITSRQLATYLRQEAGLSPGDAVAIALPNILEYPIAAWGVLRAGLVVVNTNPRYTQRELLHQFCDSGAKVLIVLEALLPLIESIIDQTEIRVVLTVGSSQEGMNASCQPWRLPLSEALELGDQLNFSPAVVRADDCALLQYTGGTTGRPIAALLTHSNLYASASLLWQTLDILDEGEEVFVAPLPLFHVYAFVAHMVIGITYGVRSILIPEPSDIPRFVRTIAHEGVTVFIGLNTLFSGLCRDENFQQLNFRHLKFTLSGGMPLIPAVAHRWYQVTGCRIYEGYGLTESSAGIIVNSPEQYKLGTIGKAMQGIEVKIINAQGDILPSGDEGELCVRGAPITRGYWRQPEATAAAISSDGWLHTGDIAVQDEEGFIRLVDRKKDLIIVSGFNVYPSEVEAVVNRMPEVLECCALGIADDKSSEAVMLCVVAGSALSEALIIERCKRELAGYKVPKKIHFMNDLPKSLVGKILRRELRDQLYSLESG